MDSSQIFNLLEELKEKADSAFSSMDIILLTEIKDKLLQINIGERFHFKEFVDDFVIKLFKLGIGLPGEALKNYEIVPPKTVELEAVIPKRKGFDETFKLVIRCLRSELARMKNYFFITLNSDTSENYNLLILYDNNYFVIPYKNCLQSQFENMTVSSIEDFRNDMQKKLLSGKVKSQNYICLLLLKSKMNATSAIKSCNDTLKEIIKLFDSAESISLRSFNATEINYEKKVLAKKNIIYEDFFDEIEYLTFTFLTNTELLFEEEKLIKLFFKDFGSPLLEYKLLERGNSGAKVIEIRPKPIINDAQARKYIVKYRPLSTTRKLNEEAKNFHKYLGPFEGFSDYMCEHQKTLTYEGIRYSYAKSDFEKFSFPFSAIINSPTNPFHSDAANKIDKLFEIEEFKHWNKDKQTKTSKIGELFEPFIKLDVYDKIQEILDISRVELEDLELIKNFDLIRQHEITTKTKVCHGDLHTNNFFVDNLNVYLIDFGFTQFLPPLIDHAFLEASIKFNHIPRFIDLELLKNIEEELLRNETFSAGYEFKSSNRKDLKYYLDIIKRIRVNSNSLLSENNKLEYLISLFIATFKLIKYSDLNQLYALHSARILSKKIVDSIS